MEFFYTDNDLLASTNPVCLQWGFYVLIGLLERVRIRMNVANTMTMVCQPGTIYG